MKHDSEETSTCAGIWVTLNYFACSWGWPVPGNLFWLPMGNWGGSLSALSHATAALKPEMSCLKLLAGIQGLCLGTEGWSESVDRSPKLQTNCALLSVTWGGETLERVSKVSDLWEWLLERWVKAGFGIMLLGLLCSSWEGQRAFPCPGCPQPPHCLPQCFRVGFWKGSGAQHLPKGEIHSFNFLVFIPLLMHPISGLKPVLCFDTGLLQMKMFNLFYFSMQNRGKKRMTHLHSLKSGKGFISRLIWEFIPLFSSLPLLLILKQAQEA